jgi:hypothetical protein
VTHADRRLAVDRFEAARAVADAVLYEGYVLYPYRASARKNQLRWQFGVLTPPAFSAADSSERSELRTECLLEAGAAARLFVRIRCLQVQHRAVEAAASAASTPHGEFAAVATLETNGRIYLTWDEAVDRVVDMPPQALTTRSAAAHEQHFRFAAGSEIETIHDATGAIAGRIVRSRQRVDGLVRVEVSAAGATDDENLLKVAVTVENGTPWTGSVVRRDDVLGQSLVAVHAMLAVEDGAFVSLLDPPARAAEAGAACRQDGLFPVLIGTGDVMLAAPIILYDRPEVAPESPGDLCDATEIDEILALRVLTLTEGEKFEARATDSRAAAIVDRCDEMSPEMWSRLHGTMRAFGSEATSGRDAAALDATASEQIPWWDPATDETVDPGADCVLIGDVEVKRGAPVRLQPTHRADAHDLFLRDMTATVAGVFEDVDGRQHVAVTLDDDPARDELLWQGRYLYFHPDEIVPLADRDPQ